MAPRQLCALLLATLLVLTGCSGGDADRQRATQADIVETSTPTSEVPERRVVAISIDALSSRALREVGREGAPVLHRLMREGAATLNARTVVEQTDTLPNHVGMVTSLPIDAEDGGHGVTWNYDKPEVRTVQEAAGGWVDSIFQAAERAGLSAAVFAAKDKFSLFQRSWPAGVDLMVIEPDNEELVDAAVEDLSSGARAFTMIHLSLPDSAGHQNRFQSPEHLAAVEESDALVGRIVQAIEGSGYAFSTSVIVTADHGGEPGEYSHGDEDVPANYTIPFIVWGPEVAEGADLYDLSGQLESPGREQVDYDARRQPVRNAALGNLAAELLGLQFIHKSQINSKGELDWR